VEKEKQSCLSRESNSDSSIIQPIDWALPAPSVVVLIYFVIVFREYMNQTIVKNVGFALYKSLQGGGQWFPN
jgi:hypothetical protein